MGEGYTTHGQSNLTPGDTALSNPGFFLFPTFHPHLITLLFLSLLLCQYPAPPPANFQFLPLHSMLNTSSIHSSIHHKLCINQNNNGISVLVRVEDWDLSPESALAIPGSCGKLLEEYKDRSVGIVIAKALCWAPWGRWRGGASAFKKFQVVF